jgi:hypothetical protein
MRREKRLTIPQVLERFARYYQRPGNEAWGDLHVVLDDQNVTDDFVDGCEQSIREWFNSVRAWDHETASNKMYGLMLCHYLRRLSKTQRLKLPHAVDRYLLRAKEPGRFTWKHWFTKGPFSHGRIKVTCKACGIGASAGYSVLYRMIAKEQDCRRATVYVAENAIYRLKYSGCPHVGERGENVSIEGLVL